MQNYILLSLLFLFFPACIFCVDDNPIDIPLTESSWRCGSPVGITKEFSLVSEGEIKKAVFHVSEKSGLCIYRERGTIEGYEIKVINNSSNDIYHDSRVDQSASPRMVLVRVPAGSYTIEIENRERGPINLTLSLCRFTDEQMDKIEQATRAEFERLKKSQDLQDRENVLEKVPAIP